VPRPFFAIAANMMRRILVDHARAKLTSNVERGCLGVGLDEQVMEARNAAWTWWLSRSARTSGQD